ncbi:hypothetical protein OOK58_12445 [Streptomyces sp. NBC_01728]|uniref:hypothetical protein n=1 Tax=unclassified Streptomyces TaxID=2593676 RepID=UPI002258DFC5|nr:MULTISPECIES: hypothetical protein [unclassified Streptomyces]MCX4452894.1 hypothetical protein [Streptomyces sp. NBC_01719]MCX4492254.1 hypothetical protein [Streptomyces sp. NBC_01728]
MRYVGQTTNHLQLRLSQHINNPTNPGMRMWINGLTADAQVPRIDLLREVPAADLDEAEHAEILAHLGAGHPLLNHPYYLAHSAVDQAPGQPSHRATVGSSRVGSGSAPDSWRRRLKRRLKELKHRETQALHRWILAEEQRRLAEDVQRSEVKAGHFDAYTLTATIKRLVVDSEEARRRYLAVRKTRKRTARLRRPGWIRRRRKKVPSRLGLGLRRLKLILRSKTPPVAPYVPTLLRDRQPFQHPAKYEGGHLITSWGVEYFVGAWDTAQGRLCIIYPLAWRGGRIGYIVSTARDLADTLKPTVTAVLRSSLERVGGDKFPVVAVDADYPEDTYETDTAHLYELLGHKVPWWPMEMRRSEYMMRWRPDGPSAAYAAIPTTDLDPLCRVVDAESSGSPVPCVLQPLIWRLQKNANDGARWELDEAREEYSEERVIIPVTLDRHQSDEPKDPTTAVAREAWSRLLARTDTDALACCRAAQQWNSGADFPLGYALTLPSNHGFAVTEWLERLTPSAPTAAALLLVDDVETEIIFRDPLTDIPVIQEPGRDIHTYAPRRLETTGVLAELILDSTVWIRTDDGILHIAPQPGGGQVVTWGYSGGGPGCLMVLIQRMLLNAASDMEVRNDADYDWRSAPSRLQELVSTSWPNGTVFTRAELEEACARDDPPGVLRYRPRRPRA